ncbi:RNA pseudouridine synthase 3, mitochondrial [Artemisia annua]|uniref:RNA pseudouridine synthase 3, mitochondrial n=1 Tax=Artemisia annua TaxID=35608 RepID=A0A2U1NG84_ARTAN|nr:RNA pseudouridine synthase 3, mitochondrial [Artemisia annua]
MNQQSVSSSVVVLINPRILINKALEANDGKPICLSIRKLCVGRLLEPLEPVWELGSPADLALIHVQADRTLSYPYVESAWHDAYETTYQKYRAPVINILKEKEGLICSPHTKGVLNGGTTERIMLAYGLEASQEVVTEYRVFGPTISGC